MVIKYRKYLSRNKNQVKIYKEVNTQYTLHLESMVCKMVNYVKQTYLHCNS